MLKCWNCHTSLDASARFCPQCGSPQRLGTEATVLTQAIKEELHQLFLSQFKQRIHELFGKKWIKTYTKRLEDSGFLPDHNRKLSFIFSQSKTFERPDSEIFFENQLDKLIYEFVIRYCGDLNEFDLPLSILNYFSTNPENLKIQQMAYDMLDFRKEDALTVYSNIDKIPPSQFKNASKAFYKPKDSETLACIVDISVFGNFKEGFAITNRAFYWKDLLGKAKAVSFQELQTIQKVDQWLTINGHYFNVKQSINGKVLIFLRTLKGIYSQQ